MASVPDGFWFNHGVPAEKYTNKEIEIKIDTPENSIFKEHEYYILSVTMKNISKERIIIPKFGFTNRFTFHFEPYDRIYTDIVDKPATVPVKDVVLEPGKSITTQQRVRFSNTFTALRLGLRNPEKTQIQANYKNPGFDVKGLPKTIGVAPEVRKVSR